MSKKQRKILVTGSSGFIGFHLSKLLLENNHIILGVDGVTDYYDVNLKIDRQNQLIKHKNFTLATGLIERKGFLENLYKDFKPDIFIHLAAQAGVRYSIENPFSYTNSNLVGTHNILEIIRNYGITHFLVASSSSVYGSNKQMPFKETQKCDTQMSYYAATKKANEVMCHSYSHLYSIPTTMLRFFTVYGPWGRPDMALFKFTDLIKKGKSIDVYNNGMMKRDFTYISDIVRAIKLLIDVVPEKVEMRSTIIKDDSISDVAPWRVVNIGSSKPVSLLEFIEIIDNYLGIKSKKNFLPLQPGDVTKTWANTYLLNQLTNFKTEYTVKNGVESFIKWYLDYKRGA